MFSVASLDLIRDNLFSPMVLAFVLGLIAVRFKSDLKLPDGAYAVLSYYLLLSLGFKGGANLRDASFDSVILPVLTALTLGCILPLIAYHVAIHIGKCVKADGAALAAHYGSVSVVTFMAALVFVEKAGDTADGFMTALVAILEIPGIVIGLLLAQSKVNPSDISLSPKLLWYRIKSIIMSKSILLLLGGLCIGFISGPKGIEPIAPFFIAPFKGVLVLFLLDMGILAGQRLQDLSNLRAFVPLYAIIIPLINACLAIACGHFIGLSIGSTTTLAAMCASASYIAAPAAVRMAIPNANPAIYLTSAIVITFPFNLALGIPLYYTLTKIWYNLFS